MPLYTGKDFQDYWGAAWAPETANSWDGVTLALASSQLLKRRDRQAELLNAAPWDLVLVDEAHHARRKDFLDQKSYRPNRLLELLRGLRARTQGLLLMTATPMQVDPIEVWDLLELLGLSGEWGTDGRDFLRFYAELRKPEPDWAFIFRMAQAERRIQGAQPDAAWQRQVERLGAVERLQLQQVLEAADPERAAAEFDRLTPPARALAETWLAQTTPLRRLVFRNTRPLLRDYVKRGLLRENVAARRPQLIWVEMREEERALYLRIEEYISNFYRKYEAQRRGLGFVMTVYRRRLTSSFYAVRRSLERRLAFLRGQAGLFWDDDDLEQDALMLDLDEELPTERAADYQEELGYVEDFLHALELLSGHDSKIEQLQRDLETAFRQRDTALVFTQYTDTLDFLRDQLRQRYGSQVACYSGRGGEWWDGNAWVPITKEMLKQDFRQGERIKILLATEAASEGLNLQTCGVLINYDMPWNPMRVEQRIGRVDRIGQRYNQVWIYNYFYANTVEANVYKALNTRIDWFEAVVGPLQPILAQVGRAIQRAAMTGDAERAQVLARELADIAAALDGLEAQLNLDAWAAQAEGPASWPAPVALPELATVVLEAPTLAAHFRPHERLPEAYWLTLDGQEHAVTFDRQTFDEHPNTLQLLTYGNPLWERLLALVSPPENAVSVESVLRITLETPLPRVAYFTRDATGGLQPVADLATLRQAWSHTAPLPWTETELAAGQHWAQAAVEAEWEQVRRQQEQLQQAQRTALVARAGRLLLDAALIELALGQQLSFLDEGGYPHAFDEQAVLGLRRHGYPWAPLTVLVQREAVLSKPQPTDPFFASIQDTPSEQLKRQLDRLTHQAKQLLKELAAAGP